MKQCCKNMPCDICTNVCVICYFRISKYTLLLTVTPDKCLYDPLSAISNPPNEKYAVLRESKITNVSSLSTAGELMSRCLTHVWLSPCIESSNL